MKEIWKDIIGYENLYQISSLGRIKSLHYNHTNLECILKGVKSNKGYLLITLYNKNNNKKYKAYLIHRLVTIHFIPNPENKPDVNHKFGIKDDNRASELEWATQSENEKHAHKFGLKNFNGERHWSKLTQIEVDEIREKYSTGNYLQKKLAKEYNVLPQHISRIVNFKRWVLQ
jgi:NUMOD4 motif